MTEEEKLERKRKLAARRSKRYRERQKQVRTEQEEKSGLATIELALRAADRERLDTMCQLRAVVNEPYSREEYIAELVEQDEKRYQEQVAALGCCGKCKSPLPQGCEGLFQGDSECWRTRDYRELML
ncbi:hypothetical protein ACOCGL_003461 [Vibrio cholerae]